MTAAFYQNETKFYVAVDCIILGFDQKELNVLLYKRKFEPMMGQWSLMGGFIKAGESIEEAASRVLTDCTGIDNLFMEQVGAYGDITRDLGERVISVAYYSLVNMNDFSSETLEEYNAVWAKVSEVPQLIFDHNQMITDTLARLRRKSRYPVRSDSTCFPKNSRYRNCRTCMKPSTRLNWTSVISAKTKCDGYSGEVG